MATKIEGIELKAVTHVFLKNNVVEIKPESLKEEANGYTFQDLNGHEYWSAQIAVSNHPSAD